MSEISLTKNKSTQYSIKAIAPSELNNKDVANWTNLETNAIESNAFLSPYFVLPALQYLEKNSKVVIIRVDKISAGLSSLVGFFIFKISKFNKYFPFPHISIFHSSHSYLTGLLADKDHAEEVTTLIFNHLKNFQTNQYGIFIEEQLAEGPLHSLIENSSHTNGLKWISFKEWDRNVLHLEKIDETRSSLSKNLLKNFKRRLKGLKELGTVEYQLISQGNVTPNHVTEFLKLEHMGWKGKRKSSLYSSSQQTSFFQEMIRGFNNDNRAFFMLLKLNGTTISSSSNLISGDAGFAFKIGWDPLYAKYSPGILNEVLFLDSIKNEPSHIKYIDSCTSDSPSYLNDIWIEKRKIRTGVYVYRKFENLVLPIIRFGVQPSIKLYKTLKQIWKQTV